MYVSSNMVENFLAHEIDHVIQQVLPPTLVGKFESLIVEQLKQNLVSAWKQHAQDPNQDPNQDLNEDLNEDPNQDLNEDPNQDQLSDISDNSNNMKEISAMTMEDINIQILNIFETKPNTKPNTKPTPFALFKRDNKQLSQKELARLWIKYKTSPSKRTLLEKYYK